MNETIRSRVKKVVGDARDEAAAEYKRLLDEPTTLRWELEHARKHLCRMELAFVSQLNEIELDRHIETKMYLLS